VYGKNETMENNRFTYLLPLWYENIRNL